MTSLRDGTAKQSIYFTKFNIIKFVQYCFFIFLFCFSFFAYSQKTKKIEILNADSLLYDEAYSKDFRRLIGNVQMKHENAIMYCDSAHFYSEKNSFDAYSNVYIKQGDSLHLYGDFLKYDGNTKIAKVRRNVKLLNNDAVLTTDSLDFDRNTEIGHYFRQGKIVQKDNVLTSIHGYYHAKTHDYFSINKVVLTNPDYVMYSDTLRYNTNSEISFFYGPTEIVSDSNYIYCENGWYNTKTDVSQYNKNAYLKSKEQTLKGDSLYYDRKNAFGRAFNNVEMIDTVQNIILKGNFAEYHEIDENSLLTDSAVFIQIADKDTFYLHADTLRSILDSTKEYKLIRAYYKVKMFKNDMQGMCDSLIYSFRDSVIKLFDKPVLWADSNQLSANYIEIHTKNESIDYLFLDNLAFIISPEDTLKFNQIKGKKMTAYFKNEELYKVYVEGNGQTLYFPKEGEDIIGMNKSESSNLMIYVKNKDFDRIVFLTKPVAKLLPLENVSVDDFKLKDFLWLDRFRPKTKEEIFKWE